MTVTDDRIDDLLRAAMRGSDAAWTDGLVGIEQRMIERIAYHGLAGLLNEQARMLPDWPAAVTDYLRDQGIALAMWELRHEQLLETLLAALTVAGVRPIVLKGTALAYDLYALPSTRARGDTDLLVAETDLMAARGVLERLDYDVQPLDEGIADDLALQEVWSLRCGAGTSHHIDLHWQLINAPALGDLLDFATCAVDPLPLPRLGPTAQAMNRPLTLLHSCVHRAMHLTSPYIVDGVTHYGGDRLIWAKDIDLLAAALSADEWHDFTSAAITQGVAAVCANGLAFAHASLGTAVPEVVTMALGQVRGEWASSYLLGAGQARRAWLDLRSVVGWRRKLAYIGARSLPSARFMRGKYPELGGQPLAMLHIRRVIDLFRPRTGRAG